MSKAVGIDLGTTNSVVAHMKKSRPEVIDNQDSDPLTPSVVYFSENNEQLVGKLARRKGGSDPANTVYSIKRFIGRNYATQEVDYDRQRVPYQVVESPDGEVEVDIHGRRYSPQEISAFVLESLKRDAESMVDDQVSHAVITVPAYFGTRMREATRQAGQLAGLEVLRILPEPTAAALAYGFEADSDEPKTILVYDLGGGTFDVTVMLLAAGLFEDLGKTGDMHLGGDDFDNLLVDWAVKQISIQHRVDVRSLPERERYRVMFQLKNAAEEAKIRLTKLTQAAIIAPALLRDKDNRLVDVEFELSRGEFNQMIQPHVDRSLRLVDEAIRLARITQDDLTAILLVGGSTKVPLVEEAMRSRFGSKVIRGEVNPMECVAEGAALQTLLVDPDTVETGGFQMRQCDKCGTRNTMTRSECRACGKPFGSGKIKFVEHGKGKLTVECSSCGKSNEAGVQICIHCGNPVLSSEKIILERIPVPIGIQLAGDEMDVILDTDKYYPTEEPESVTRQTTRPDQRSISVPVYEGWDREKASNNTLIGTAQGSLPAGLPVNTAVRVSLSIDRSGVLYVTATLPDRPEVKIEASMQWKGRIDGGGGGGGGGNGGGGGEGDSDWRSGARFTLFLGAAVLREGQGILPAEMLENIRQMGSQLLAAVEVNDERNGVPLMEKLDEALKQVGIFCDLGLMRHLYDDPDLAEKVGLNLMEQMGEYIHRADQCKQRGDVQGFIQAVRDGGPVFQQVLEKLPSGAVGLPSDLLGRSSHEFGR